MQTENVRRRHDSAAGNQVQASFAKIVPIADRAAALFYDRLFEMAPETRALFRRDMKTQREKLMSTLAIVVNSLGDLDALIPVARDLAQRHVAYGVAPEHYSLAGSALLWALEQGLADDSLPQCARHGMRRIPLCRR